MKDIMGSFWGRPVRFLGTSNGYYSETVYFAEV